MTENARNQAVQGGNMYVGYNPPPPGDYPPSIAGYGIPRAESAIGGPTGNQSVIGGPPMPNQAKVPPGMQLNKLKNPKGKAMSKYPPWDPRWEKDHQKLLKRHQAEQQKLLKEQQKRAQKQLKLQQEQLKVQEAQMRRTQEEQMKQFQEQQWKLQEEQDKQLRLLQQYADLQQQQQQMPAGVPNNSPMPIYDYSTLGTFNLDYSTLGTLAYGTYPGTQQNAAASAAYANAYWAMPYQQYPCLFANYTLPSVQTADDEAKEERGQKRHSRARYRKNRHSKEATLITEDNRRYRSNSDSESSELFISGSDCDGENADALKNQLLAQKSKLKKTEETAKEQKRSPKSPKNQPAFMAELQKKLKDKQKNLEAVPIQTPPDPIYGTTAPIYAFVPGGPVPMVPGPPPPVVAPYIAPGALQVMNNTTNEEIEAVKLMKEMNVNSEDGPVLPLAQRNETNEDIYDDEKSAIYAVPQKKRTIQPQPKEDDYEEQASGLIIDDVVDDMEEDTRVVDINKKQLIKIDGHPDDMMSAVFTADKDGAETIYATNEDVLPITGGGDAEAAEVGVEQEEEVNMVLGNEDPPPGRGAAELGVWREDHGTQRSPPPSYFAFSPDEGEGDPHASNMPPGNARPPRGNGRYRKARSPQRRPNKRGLRPNNNPNQNQNRYPAQPRSRNSNCTIQ